MVLLLAASLVCFALIVQGSETGCEVDGKDIPIGQQYDLPDKCYSNVCKGDNQWTVGACGLIGVPRGWGVTSDDPSKPYPECCGQPTPPMDIVPDVLQEAGNTDELVITYEGDVKVDNGNKLTPTQVKSQPQVFYKANPKDYYFLAMVDPDAPSRDKPTAREFVHWLVGNILGNNISTGDTLASYIGSGPPQGTGYHRYVLLLYKQPGKLTFTERFTNAGSRRMFSIQKFAEKYNLVDPSVNVYQAMYDDYVPVIHRQLSKLK